MPATTAQHATDRTAAPRPRHLEQRTITLGVLLTGRRTVEIALPAVEELEHRLAHLYPSVRWKVQLCRHAASPALREVGELLDCGRRRLLAEGWTLALVLTDLPLRSEGRPVASHASRTHGVGIISLPALGPVQSRRRLIATSLEVVAGLIGERPDELRRQALRQRHRDRAATRRRLRELATSPRPDLPARFFAVRALRAHARLLAGMVAANRPWRLAAHLYRGLVAALAFVSFSVVNQGTWQLAVTLGVPRLVLVTVAALAIMVASLILVHHLWERAEHPRAREQVLLFNAATTLTLLGGVLTLYLAMLGATFLTTLVLLPAGVLGSALHRPAHLSEYLQLAWLISSLATIGGALGAALESDEAVREATYAAQETAEHTLPSRLGDDPTRLSSAVSDDAAAR